MSKSCIKVTASVSLLGAWTFFLVVSDLFFLSVRLETYSQMPRHMIRRCDALAVPPMAMERSSERFQPLESQLKTNRKALEDNIKGTKEKRQQPLHTSFLRSSQPENKKIKATGKA